MCANKQSVFLCITAFHCEKQKSKGETVWLSVMEVPHEPSFLDKKLETRNLGLAALPGARASVLSVTQSTALVLSLFRCDHLPLACTFGFQCAHAGADD